MKRILIITTTRDNQGSAVSLYDSIEDIEEEYQDMVRAAITGGRYEKDDLWASDGICGSDRGYIFNGATDITFPMTVDHIIDYVF